MTVNKVKLGDGLDIPAAIDNEHLKKKIREWYVEQVAAPTGTIKYVDKKGKKYKVATTYSNDDVFITQIDAA